MNHISNQRHKRSLLHITLLLFFAIPVLARDYEPDEIVNPNIANRYEYVADPENRLSPQTRRAVNARLQALRDSTSAEVAVAVVPSIGDYTIEDFSEKVFTRWGLGKKDKDNGVLLLISPDSREVRIQTGYGTEGVLPDITCGHIINTAVIPSMRDDCLDCAVDEATKMITEIMEDPVYAEELKSKLSDNHSGLEEAPVSKETLMGFLGFVAFILWLLAAFNYIKDRLQTRKMTSSIEKAQKWRSTLTFFGFMTLGTLLTALPFYLLALYHYRHARYGTHKCDNCGGKTHVMKGEEAMGALTPSQQFEEKLGSVNYDVHKCEKCGKTEVVPYPASNTPYSYCPHCGTRAYHFIGKRTLRQPTYQAEGQGVSQYRCEYCGNQDEKGYRIPKKDMSEAIATAAAIGAATRGRRGGGGFGGFGGGGFGGGFGGGATGGGGASGRW